jgi:hypothetical protein
MCPRNDLLVLSLEMTKKHEDPKKKNGQFQDANRPTKSVARRSENFLLYYLTWIGKQRKKRNDHTLLLQKFPW